MNSSTCLDLFLKKYQTFREKIMCYVLLLTDSCQNPDPCLRTGNIPWWTSLFNNTSVMSHQILGKQATISILSKPCYPSVRIKNDGGFHECSSTPIFLIIMYHRVLTHWDDRTVPSWIVWKIRPVSEVAHLQCRILAGIPFEPQTAAQLCWRHRLQGSLQLLECEWMVFGKSRNLLFNLCIEIFKSSTRSGAAANWWNCAAPMYVSIRTHC